MQRRVCWAPALGTLVMVSAAVLLWPAPRERSLPTLGVAAPLAAEKPASQSAAGRVLLASAPLAALASIDDPRLIAALRTEVDAACRAPVLLILDGRKRPDPRRDWALSELKRRCAEVPVPSMYVPVEDTRAPLNERQADASDALAALRAADSNEALMTAWLDAYASRALPQQEIFPDGRLLLPAEAEALMRAALDWRACEHWAACGPDSLITLRVCALHGCEPGSDLRMAYHEALAPRDFEALMAILRWLERLRKA